MKARNYLAIVVFVGFLLSIVAGCKAPDEMTNTPKDSTNSAMKKAGGDD